MAKRVQRRRGTTSEHSAFTGAEGEITVDTTIDTLVVHDGSTAGGHPLGKADGSNLDLTNQIGIVQLDVTDGQAGWFLKTDGAGTLSFAAIDVGGTALGGSKLGGTISNATIDVGAVGISELAVTEAASNGSAGHFLRTDGSGTLSFAEVVTDPNMGGMLGGITSNASINNDVITSGMLTTALKNFTVDDGVGAAGIDTFNLTAAPGSVNSVIAYIDGIVQPPSAYSILTSPNRIVFTSDPPVGAVIRIVHLGFQSTVGTPSDGTITNAKLATNSVESDNIVNLTIATDDIANNAITDAKIDANTITNASIAANTITNVEINAGTITGTQIADNAIGGDKISLSGNVQGDIMYYDQTLNWVRLAAGTNGHVLTTVGANANPYWAAGSSGTALPGTGTVGNVLTNVGGTWTSASPPPGTTGSGAVAKTEIVSTSTVTAPGSNYNVYTDLTGLSGSITPTVTTSKVFLSGHVMLGIQSRTMLIRIMRSIAGSGYVEVGSGPVVGARIGAHSSVQGDAGSNGPSAASIHFVDTPSFSSGQAITYKIQARDNALASTGPWWCNAGVNDSNTGNWPRTISGFTIQELL